MSVSLCAFEGLERDRSDVYVGIGGTGWLLRSFAYQCLHGAVQSVPVVPPELGVGALQRGIPRGLGLLDAE